MRDPSGVRLVQLAAFAVAVLVWLFVGGLGLVVAELIRRAWEGRVMFAALLGVGCVAAVVAMKLVAYLDGGGNDE